MTRDTRRQTRAVLIPLIGGLLIVILFALNITLPVEIGAPLMLISTVWGFFWLNVSTVSLLPRLMILLYSLPFSTTINYLYEPAHTWWRWPHRFTHIWQVKVDPVPLMHDHTLISQMVMVGLAGLFGLLAGIALVARRGTASLASAPHPRSLDGSGASDAPYPTLGVGAFVAAIGLILLLSWIFAPSETIFTAAYKKSVAGSIAAAINFRSAFHIASVLIVLLFLDAERSKQRGTGYIWKVGTVLALTLGIAVFLQFLQGERDAVGTMLAMMALYVTAPLSPIEKKRTEDTSDERQHVTADGSDQQQATSSGFVVNLLQRSRNKLTTKRVFGCLRPPLPQHSGDTEKTAAQVANAVVWRRIIVLVVPLAVLASIAVLIGVVREGISSRQLDIPHELASYWKYSPWNSVLLTNLFMAETALYGQMKYEAGQTYLDYLISLPPGFITRPLGIERPIDRHFIDGWGFAGKSAGGIHIAVIPFKNFGIAGVMGVLLLYGFFIATLEAAAMGAAFWPRLLYGTTVSTAIFWFWYGDMTMIRGLMIAGLVGVGYQLWLHVTRNPDRCLT